MHKLLQINLFICFNLVIHFKFTTSFHSCWHAWVQLSIANSTSVQPGLKPYVFSSMLNRDETGCSNLSAVSWTSVSQSISFRHKLTLDGHISGCRHILGSMEQNSFWWYKPFTKCYWKFKEGKKNWNNRDYFISFLWAWICSVCCVCFFSL